MITGESTMRIPCSRCGQLNIVERAAEVSFRCSACESSNIVRTLAASSGAWAPEREPARQSRWRTAVSTTRPSGRPVQKTGGERSGAMSRAKQVLVGLMVLAVVSTFVRGGGTFATFNASTTNASNITTGVLLLGDKVANGASVAECFSSGASISGANTAACTSVWNVAGPNKPNDSFIAHLALRNPGNLNASIFQLYAAAGACDTAPGYLDPVSGTTFKGATQAVATTLNGATIIGAISLVVASSAGFVIGGVVQVDTLANLEQLTISAIPDGTHLTVNAATKGHANGVAVNGSGLCRQAQLVVAKTDGSYENATLANTTCLYGNSLVFGAPMTVAGNKCSYDSLHNLRDFNDNYAVGGNPGPLGLGSLAAGATQNYIIAINFPTGSDNGYQGLGTALNFTWFAQQ
ncbi:MAG TPA: hypothetical protein VIO62_16700 [Candidatus Dormibacteraeota bacterium]|jgi:hypothetical protein